MFIPLQACYPSQTDMYRNMNTMYPYYRMTTSSFRLRRSADEEANQ